MDGHYLWGLLAIFGRIHTYYTNLILQWNSTYLL